jgi:glycolate dehydrogenase FAD-binding subunit
VDLISPETKDELREALRDASERGTRVLIAGGRTDLAKGEPTEVDADLAVTVLDRVIAYDPAEMLAVVEGGMRIGDLRAALAEGGQEWPADAIDGATVGGTIASATSSPRRLRTGPLRDTVVEMELVTGDGRLIRSGARTVKNVTGYDVHRLATGSLGTIGAIAQVALKLRPLPKARRLLITHEGGLDLGRTMLAAVPLPSAVIAAPDRVEMALEGWPGEVEEQTAAARRLATSLEIEDRPVRGHEAIDAPIVVEVAVAPSKLDAVLAGETEWRALIGVGIAWVGLPLEGGRLAELRRRVAEAGGIAPVICGPGGLGDAPVAALEVHRRLKAAFDPAGILAPGRFWGGQ